MDVATRADLKSDVLKDLDKQKRVLNSYRGNPAISEQVLDDVVGQLEHCFTTLSGLPGKAGQSLTENDWLMVCVAGLSSLEAPANLICLPILHGSTKAPRRAMAIF